MKVFVSHSMKDQSILERISSTIGSHGIKFLIAEHKIDIKNSITNKIKNMIESSDVGLVLLTKNGIDSGFVREEIGYLEAKNKPTLMIFESGVKENYGGFKHGYDYIELNSKQPEVAVEQMRKTLMSHWETMAKAKKEAVLQKEESEKRLAFGAIAILFILAILD